MKKPIVAIMYDFDKTLCTRDMQEYTFIPSVGMEPGEFWGFANEVATAETMDRILSYMYCMVEKARQTGNPLTRESLVACGKDIEYHPGVEGWFERINRYAEEAGVEVEHYVLSSGLKEIIEGSSIAKYFKRIYACEFLYKDGQAYWPKMAVNYTNKTQFVYRINKGVLNIYNDVDLNNSRPDSEKRVFFSNMIYIGDGLTDVPCMKLVKQSGGHSIAIYQAGEKHKTAPLLKHDRVDWMFEADYSEGSELDRNIKLLLENLAYFNKLKGLHEQQKKELN
ncbi:MAG: haloacid dehalogenase-like hydrolase [Oscillospiraceae bacterium]|nr:haloacid dehalogenase-like hydrolase [Oscillospiraceae bacterium]